VLHTSSLGVLGQLALLAGSFVLVDNTFLGGLRKFALSFAVALGVTLFYERLKRGLQAALGFAVAYRGFVGNFYALFG